VRVLIADDEWLVAAALRKQMEWYGHEVVGTVGSGAEALARCCAQRPDLVLMDVQMPEMDGIAATRRLMERRPTCVVIVTGRADLEEAAEQAGAMRYVVKPLLESQIPMVVEEARRRFGRFLEVLEESKSLESALAGWCTVQGATHGASVRDGISEEEAYERLQQQAWKSGVTLAEAAEEANGNGRH
jgi:AmiR/NasT family two-component response regulator